MNAIRQFIEVKNNTFNVVRPEGFNASRVEVIILPSEIEDDIPQWQKEIVLERIKHPQIPVNALDMIDQLEKENLGSL